MAVKLMLDRIANPDAPPQQVQLATTLRIIANPAAARPMPGRSHNARHKKRAPRFRRAVPEGRKDPKTQ